MITIIHMTSGVPRWSMNGILLENTSPETLEDLTVSLEGIQLPPNPADEAILEKVGYAKTLPERLPRELKPNQKVYIHLVNSDQDPETATIEASWRNSKGMQKVVETIYL